MRISWCLWEQAIILSQRLPHTGVNSSENSISLMVKVSEKVNFDTKCMPLYCPFFLIPLWFHRIRVAECSSQHSRVSNPTLNIFSISFPFLPSNLMAKRLNTNCWSGDSHSVWYGQPHMDLRDQAPGAVDPRG